MTTFPNWTVVTPMANEGLDFAPFITALNRVMDAMGSGHVILVVDRVSKDNTRELAEELAKTDPRYTFLWEPSTRNVVDAYLAGFRHALELGFEWVVEMDAGMSRDPAALPQFLAALADGNDCVFGSRFLPGGSMGDSPPLAQISVGSGHGRGQMAAWFKRNGYDLRLRGFHKRCSHTVGGISADLDGSFLPNGSPLSSQKPALGRNPDPLQSSLTTGQPGRHQKQLLRPGPLRKTAANPQGSIPLIPPLL